MSGLGVATGNPPPNGGKNDHSNDPRALLNTYIHNYLVHEGHFDLAKSIRGSKNMSLNHSKLKIENGNGRQQMNGADDSMDADSKDDLNSRLDGPNKLGDTFLLDYWFIFWDMWQASKRPSEGQGDNSNGPAGQYWDHQKAKKPKIANQQQPLLQQSMIPNGFGPFNRPNMLPPQQQQPQQQMNIQKAAMANNGRVMNPQYQNNLRMQHLAHQQMQMDGSDVDLNGQQRPPSPMSGGENAPSPKRQCRDGGPFNNGRNMAMRNPMIPQMANGAPGNEAAMRMQAKGFSPDQITGMMSAAANAQRQTYAQGVANSAKAAMNGNGMQNGIQGGMPQMSPDLAHESPNGDPNMMMLNTTAGKGGAGNGGALADYQMQLMLLEQQNKKRLMVARQENQHDPQRMVGNPPFGAQAMSPHGSKTGHSPPGSDRQRGTGQGSPMPDGSGQPNRNSPGPAAFGDLNAMNMNQPFMPSGGPMMRPPGGNPPGTPNHLLGPQHMGGRIPNAQWPAMQGQMSGQGGQQQANPDNNQARGNMPPPQAPPPGNKPSPTQQATATPTNSQNNPKNSKKKENKEPKKKTTKKNQTNTAPTPNNETERGPTPTPQTPITPVHPASVDIKGQQPNTSQSQPQQASNGNNANNMAPPPDNNNMGMGPFGNLANMDNDMFGLPPDYAVDAADVLDAFDFDTFLDTNAIGPDFPDFPLPTDGVEGGFDDEQRSTKV